MTGRRDRLAARRVELGLTQEELGEAIGSSAQSVRRWEAGKGDPRTTQRRPLADALQVTLPQLERLLTDEEEAQTHNGHAVPGWLDHYASLEQAAARLQTVEPVTIPGLLQTEAYAEAIMRHYYLPASSDDIENRVAARLKRQAVLERPASPLEFQCIIDESVLYRVTGGTQVMAAQLDHLASMILLPSVLVQVVPADGPGLHTAWFGGFRMFTSEDASEPFMVCTEDLGGVHYQDSPHVIEAHAQLFAHLSVVSLSPEQSAEMIQSTAERYR